MKTNRRTLIVWILVIVGLCGVIFALVGIVAIGEVLSGMGILGPRFPSGISGSVPSFQPSAIGLLPNN